MLPGLYTPSLEKLWLNDRATRLARCRELITKPYLSHANADPMSRCANGMAWLYVCPAAACCIAYCIIVHRRSRMSRPYAQPACMAYPLVL